MVSVLRFVKRDIKYIENLGVNKFLNAYLNISLKKWKKKLQSYATSKGTLALMSLFPFARRQFLIPSIMFRRSSRAIKIFFPTSLKWRKKGEKTFLYLSSKLRTCHVSFKLIIGAELPDVYHLAYNFI